MFDIYDISPDNHWRFSLGKEGTRKLITIGLNPSRATKEKSDTTITKVARVAEAGGFD